MLQKVLFIDDDKPTNIINERLAQRSNSFKDIKVCINSAKALNYLTEVVKNNGVYPDLIFLDINMPALNGWEFLDAFKELKLLKKIKIVMLSTADNITQTQIERYKEVVSCYETKPLSLDKIKQHVSVLGCAN